MNGTNSRRRDRSHHLFGFYENSLLQFRICSNQWTEQERFVLTPNGTTLRNPNDLAFGKTDYLPPVICELSHVPATIKMIKAQIATAFLPLALCNQYEMNDVQINHLTPKLIRYQMLVYLSFEADGPAAPILPEVQPHIHFVSLLPFPAVCFRRLLFLLFIYSTPLATFPFGFSWHLKSLTSLLHVRLCWWSDIPLQSVQGDVLYQSFCSLCITAESRKK